MRHHVVLVALALALVIGQGARADEDVDPVARYVGYWVHVGGDAEEQDRIDAIEVQVQTLHVGIRALGRKRLTKRTIIPSWYKITWAAEQFTVVADSGDVWTTPLDGTTVAFKYDGSDFELYRNLVGDEIHCHAEQNLGSTDYIYRLSDAGQTLTITAVTMSEYLEDAITYLSTYQKK